MSGVSFKEAGVDLLDEYAARIDDDRLEEWLDLFAEDCCYRIVPRENHDQDLPLPIVLCPNKNVLRDRIVSLRHANKFNLHYDRHMISGVRASAEGDGVRIEANFVVYQTSLEGESQLFAVGRYRDRARAERGRLLFVEKLVILDSFAVPHLIATPL